MTHNFTLIVPYAAVNAAASAFLEFKTPATGTIKVKAAGHSTGASLKVELVEAPTLTTGVTAVVPVNKDRESAAKSAVVVKSNPSTISSGTVVGTAFSYELNPTEYTLKKDTVYMVKVTNTEASAKDITVLMDYTEDAVSYAFPLVFTVKDDADPQVVIENASVNFNGETKLTAADGTVTFTLRPDVTYSYTVTKIGKVAQTGTQLVGYASVAKAITMLAPAAAPGPSVTINVYDSVMDTPVEGAEVTLGANDPVLTDASGKVVFANQSEAEDVAYSATKDGYTIPSGTITIEDVNVTENVYAVLDVYTVEFTVKIGETPKNYARIDFRGYTQRTNASGVLTVTNVAPGEYVYTAMYNGGYYVTGIITVVADDVDEAVALTIPV